jgi:hypothetical protein
LARFGRPDAAVITRPDRPTSETAFTEPLSSSPFGSVSTESRPSIVESISGDPTVVLIPESGYDSFISEKKLSSNRPHVLAAYNARNDPDNGFKDPTFQLSEVQYLLDSDTISTAVQIISSSIPSQQLNEVVVDNAVLFYEVKRALESLRSVYLGKRQFSRNLAGFDTALISTRSTQFINSLPADIGVSTSWRSKICNTSPFFGNQTINSFLDSYPSSLSQFSSKTMASKIINLALFSTDLCFFDRSTVSNFKEDPSLGERLGSAIYTRQGFSFPAEIAENPDYIVSPDSSSLEDAIRALARNLSGGVLKSEQNPLTTYVADAGREVPADFEPILNSLFFTENSKRIETFANSSFAATSPDGYVTFEDEVLLRCFSKTQVDAQGFLAASVLASRAAERVLQRSESLVTACRPFSGNILDPQKRVMKFLVSLIFELGSMLRSLRNIDVEAEREDVEGSGGVAVGSTDYDSSGYEFSPTTGIPNILRDVAAIAQSCTSYGTSFFDLVFIEGAQISYTVDVQIGTVPDRNTEFMYRTARIDTSDGRAWLDSRLYDAENAEIHPVFAMIDRQIASALGVSQASQTRAARSIAVQFISRALRSVYFGFQVAETGRIDFLFSRTDLAAIPRAAEAIADGGLSFSRDEGLTAAQRSRISNIRNNIVNDALTPIRAISDQVLSSLEFVDLVESYATSLASCNNLSVNLRDASSQIAPLIRVKGLVTPLALTRDSLIASSLYLYSRSQPSGIPGYSTQEVLNENEYKTILSRLLKLSQESADEDDLTYFVVGFPFGLLERCRNESPGDTDLFTVNFKFEIDGSVSTVSKSFSPNIRKTSLAPGQADGAIDQIDTDKVKTLSYIDGVQDLTRNRNGELIFSIQDTSYAQSLYADGLNSSCLIDFVWNLLGIDLSETAIRDGASYVPTSRVTDITNAQSRFFARRIQDLDTTSRARLGSAFLRTTIFGQSRAVDDVLGFKYMDCVYAFPIRASEIPGLTSSQFIGKVFVSVEPSISPSVRGNF